MRVHLTISLLASCSILFGDPKPEARDPDEVVTYRKTEQAELKLEIFRPAGWKAHDERPAIVFFFGGGWVGGSTTQFHPQATRLASRGMVAYCADYRVRSRHETSPFEAVVDAKAALRWIWRNAGRQGVDPKKIVSAGGSAGGHLAACSGLVAGHDEVKGGEPAFIPAAMVLFNPAMLLAPHDSLPKAVNARLEEASDRLKRRFEGPAQWAHPYAFAGKAQPPCIMFFGTADRLLDGAEAFRNVSTAAGNRCEIKT